MDPTDRLLRLLALLPTRPTWTGDELAERLAVTPRTVRRDVMRLRDLGYSVEAEPGRYGGYRLARGQALPPLVLSDDEAVAVALGLRTAALSGVAGLGESALTTLGKLEQVLPSRLRDRVAALGTATVHVGKAAPDTVDAEVLATVAVACRRGERLLLGYRDRAGRTTRRDVDPFRVVHAAQRWYLVARDVRRDAWRTFRIDRVTDVLPTAVRVRIEDPPDPATLVTEALAIAPYRWRATVQLDLPLEVAAHRVPPTLGRLEPDGDATLLYIGADELDWLADFLAGLGCGLTVIEPAELVAELHRVGKRLLDTPGPR